MKKLFLLSVLLFAAAASAVITPVPVNYAEITVDGTRAKLYIEGYLPNTCYGGARAVVSDDKRGLNVYVLSNVKGEVCAEVARLFDLTVDLGSFDSGSHMVHLQPKTRWGSTLSFEISR